MHPELTADALVQLVHRYHPAELLNVDPRYKESEEGQRLTALLHAHEEPSPAWKGFIQRLLEEFPDCSIWDTTVPLLDPCLSNDILSTPVPDLVPRTANYVLGQAQLIDCLFTWNRW